VLLHGVTASGKTEIYLRAVERVLERGRGSMVLVPEISLTPQMTGVFKERFGSQVAILHSRLTGSERRREWNRLQSGEASIVIGARSAVFAPICSLGLIVLDEEHEVSYKQDSTPRYHCREVAQKRAEIEGALLLLGSATPSVESYRRAETGEYCLLHLSQRVESRPLPQISLVDMREEIREGNRSIFSRPLQNRLLDTWKKGEQAILFLNRRGFATFVSCRRCGHVMRCSLCDVALTYHQSDSRLRCHYCDQKRRLPPACPDCGSSLLRQFGLGTQRVEEEARKLLPDAHIVRADFDTLNLRTGENCLEQFERGEAEILIGTQMIAKGLDFPMVTLVGVITADISLNQPDFRSGERTFQLLTQVAGRAGRGESPGEVIIQTYAPEHYSLLTAQGHDYPGFYRAEIQYRHKLDYPPYREMIRVVLSGPDESMVRTGSELLARYLEAAISQDRVDTGKAAETVLLGPAPAPLARIRGQHRWQMVLKGDLDPMRTALKQGLINFHSHNPTSKISISIDVQPLSLL
jgi:primosomal protein N' (replication factor Y)